MMHMGAVFLALAALQDGKFLAQFQPGMPHDKLQNAVKTQIAQGTSTMQIAKFMVDTTLSVGMVTTAMILASIDPAEIIKAIIAGGGEALPGIMR